MKNFALALSFAGASAMMLSACREKAEPVKTLHVSDVFDGHIPHKRPSIDELLAHYHAAKNPETTTDKPGLPPFPPIR